MAGGHAHGGKHCQDKLPHEHRAHSEALVGAAQFRQPRDTESEVKETDGEARENGSITTRLSYIYM